MFLPITEDIFFNLRWIEVTIKSFISLPPWFSVILFTQCFDFLASSPIVSPNPNQFHTIFLSKSQSFLHFYPLTCQSSLTSHFKYSHLDLPLSGWLISPSAVPVPNFYFLPFQDLCHFSVTFADIFIPGSKPSSFKPCEMPQVLKLYHFSEGSESSRVCEVQYL